MDIRITITNEDILCNPNIIDGVKALGQMLAGGEKADPAPKATMGAVETTDSYMEESQAELQIDLQEEPQAEPQAGPQADTPRYTIEQVRKTLGDLSKAKGASVAKGILKKFDVSKVTELKETDYHDVMLAVKAVG